MNIVIQHNWMVAGPGGHYGVLQYQTGPGFFDTHTGLALGPTHFDLPVPIFLIACVAGILICLTAFLVYARHSTRHNAA
ncbi:MAG TPA: hypothetical protein VJ063_17475 [Verrucomicrobiae bacterium]|nr:hypothetical protein [Verrucomicrobiae bacterium]